jgi:hypothetical protein
VAAVAASLAGAFSRSGVTFEMRQLINIAVYPASIFVEASFAAKNLADTLLNLIQEDQFSVEFQGLTIPTSLSMYSSNTVTSRNTVVTSSSSTSRVDSTLTSTLPTSTSTTSEFSNASAASAGNASASGSIFIGAAVGGLALTMMIAIGIVVVIRRRRRPRHIQPGKVERSGFSSPIGFALSRRTIAIPDTTVTQAHAEFDLSIRPPQDQLRNGSCVKEFKEDAADLDASRTVVAGFSMESSVNEYLLLPKHDAVPSDGIGTDYLSQRDNDEELHFGFEDDKNGIATESPYMQIESRTIKDLDILQSSSNDLIPHDESPYMFVQSLSPMCAEECVMQANVDPSYIQVGDSSHAPRDGVRDEHTYIELARDEHTYIELDSLRIELPLITRTNPLFDGGASSSHREGDFMLGNEFANPVISNLSRGSNDKRHLSFSEESSYVASHGGTINRRATTSALLSNLSSLPKIPTMDQSVSTIQEGVAVLALEDSTSIKSHRTRTLTRSDQKRYTESAPQKSHPSSRAVSDSDGQRSSSFIFPSRPLWKGMFRSNKGSQVKHTVASSIQTQAPTNLSSASDDFDQVLFCLQNTSRRLKGHDGSADSTSLANADANENTLFHRNGQVCINPLFDVEEDNDEASQLHEVDVYDESTDDHVAMQLHLDEDGFGFTGETVIEDPAVMEMSTIKMSISFNRPAHVGVKHDESTTDAALLTDFSLTNSNNYHISTR